MAPWVSDPLVDILAMSESRTPSGITGGVRAFPSQDWEQGIRAKRIFERMFLKRSKASGMRIANFGIVNSM